MLLYPLILLFELIVSHFVFDYGKALTPEMIQAKAKGYPITPIAKHAFLHALGVFCVLLFNSVNIWLALALSLFEFTTHLLIDISKGRIETKYPTLKDNRNPWHWHLFQLDQFLHVSSKFIIALIVIYNI